ncbi:MAG: hypothetical protein KIT31_39385 [Deltaproteobacteria bacterium]|nr:hypothetical protein [Deltaproteobacteria bacterium]
MAEPDKQDADLEAQLEAMRLPRGGIGFSVSRAQLAKILFTAGMLVLVIVIQKPCADSMSSFVTDFDHPGSGAQMPRPDNVDVPKAPVTVPKDDDPAYYVSIRAGMSEAEIKTAIEDARRLRAVLIAADPDRDGWYDYPALFAAAAAF